MKTQPDSASAAPSLERLRQQIEALLSKITLGELKLNRYDHGGGRAIS